mgnify:CR=1 FL=1
MAEEEKEQKKYEIETIKEIAEAKKKAAKGRGITFKPYVDDVKTRTAMVEEKRQKIITVPASEKLLAKLRSRNKLTARERLNLFFDEGTFVEEDMFIESQIKAFGMGERYTPADGVVGGFGKVDGRLICAYATDYSVLAGASGEGHMMKISKITRRACDMRVPIVGFLDSAGVRLQEAQPSAVAYGELYYLQSQFSGVVPQIMIICGGVAAGQAYSPLLTDIIIMTRTGGDMWIGGPRAAAGVTGGVEDITGIGGADYHMKYTGQCHLAVDDDEEAIKACKRVLSYLPSNCDEMPPDIPPTDDPYRREERLLEILPKDPRRSYDAHEIVDLIADKGSFMEFQDEYAKQVIIGFGRFDGHVAGIYAGNPAYLAGCFEPDSCDKLVRHFTFCDCFNIPIIYLVDNPALIVGDEWERKGLIRHGTKLLHTTNTLTVPRISILVRKVYGGTMAFFSSRGKVADFVYAWPTAELCPMGPDGAVSIIYDREIKSLPTSEERLAFAEEKKKEYFHTYVDPIEVAKNARISQFDDIIDPRRTRETIINALKLCKTKKDWHTPPGRKHTNRPV